MEFISEKVQEGKEIDLKGCFKSINLKYVVFWSADVWNNVKDTTIQRSLNTIIEIEKENEEDICNEDDNNFYELATQINELKDVTLDDINTWVFMERGGGDELSKADPIDFTSDRNDPQDSEEEEQGPKISYH